MLVSHVEDLGRELPKPVILPEVDAESEEPQPRLDLSSDLRKRVDLLSVPLCSRLDRRSGSLLGGPCWWSRRMNARRFIVCGSMGEVMASSGWGRTRTEGTRLVRRRTAPPMALIHDKVASHE